MEEPMKKFVAILGIILAAVCYLNGELVVSLGGGYAGGVGVTDFNFSDTKKFFTDHLTINWSNAGLFESKGGLSVNAAVSTFFSYTFGVGISAGHMKSTVTLDSSFNTTMTWWDSEVWTDDKEWMNEGSVTVIPISLNFIYRASLSESMKLNLSAGPTLYLVSIDLQGNAGFPGTLSSGGYWYADWYDLNMTASESTTAFGGRVAVDLEIGLSEGMAFYVGGSYYIAGKIDTVWEPVPGSYTGEWGELKKQVTVDNTPLNLITEVNISTFVIEGGIKVYL